LPHGDTYRQGIDKHPQHTIGMRTRLHAPRQHRAKHYVITPREPTQLILPRLRRQLHYADFEINCNFNSNSVGLI
jgi:hypothetical protein